jgi:LysM repeat protein
MNDSPEKEMKDLMEGLADDLGYAANNENPERPRESLDSKPKRKILVLWGGVIILFIAVIALLFGGGSNVATEQRTSIQPRIDRIEERLERLEGMYERIVHLEKQEENLKKSIAKVDRSGQSLAKRLENVSQEVKTLQKTPTPVAVKTEPPRADEKKETPEAKRRYHVVRSGDSPYGIAQKYGISVTELRRLNNLSKKQLIYPGQKLLISKDSGQ